MKRKYSVFIGNVGTCFDRHCPKYSDKEYSYSELFDRVASIDLVTGVDLVTEKDFYDNIDAVRKGLARTKLKVASIVVNLFGQPLYKQGSFSSVDPKARKQALEDTLRTKDIAEEFGCEFITIWPGQDGWDYHFQADYAQERTWFADGVRAACEYKPKIGVALEYKIREPRAHNYINTVGNTILTVKEVNRPNCGIALDIGHSFFSYENSAESVALIHKWGGNLMHMHMNDNYSSSDDDLMVGTVHTIEFLEFIYWIRKTGYNGWFTMDQFPYREDGRDAIDESTRWFDALETVMDNANMDEIADVLKKKDAVLSSKLMRKLLFPAYRK